MSFVSQTFGSQTLSKWEIKDLGEIYIFSDFWNSEFLNAGRSSTLLSSPECPFKDLGEKRKMHDSLPHASLHSGTSATTVTTRMLEVQYTYPPSSNPPKLHIGKDQGGQYIGKHTSDIQERNYERSDHKSTKKWVSWNKLRKENYHLRNDVTRFVTNKL